MSKFRVSYVAVKRRQDANKGIDEILFREEKTVTVEAADKHAAVAAVQAFIPKDTEFTLSSILHAK